MNCTKNISSTSTFCGPLCDSVSVCLSPIPVGRCRGSIDYVYIIIQKVITDQVAVPTGISGILSIFRAYKQQVLGLQNVYFSMRVMK